MRTRTTLLLPVMCLGIAVSSPFAQQDKWVVMLQVHIVEKDVSPVVSIPHGERGGLEVEGFGSFDFLPTIDDGDAGRVTVRIYGPESEERPLVTIEVVEGEVAVATDTSPSFKLSVLKVFQR